jgi:hypothetical protein
MAVLIAGAPLGVAWCADHVPLAEWTPGSGPEREITRL